MRDDFKKLAEEFIKYLKDEDFEGNFNFVLNDGSSNFNFGTGMPHCGFGNWIFITSMYGDESGSSVSTLVIGDFDDDVDDLDDYLGFITDYYYNNYKDWNVVID